MTALPPTCSSKMFSIMPISCSNSNMTMMMLMMASKFKTIRTIKQISKMMKVNYSQTCTPQLAMPYMSKDSPRNELKMMLNYWPIDWLF